MLKKFTVGFLASVLLLSGSALSVSASPVSKQNRLEKISEAKAYITESTQNVTSLLNSLKGKGNISIEDVENTIAKYYSANPAPSDIVNDPSLSLADVFPEKVYEIKQISGDTFNLNNFVEEKKNEDEVISFMTDNGSIDTYVDETGIFILHHETLNDSKAETSLNPMSASWSYTPNDRETGICYNALGAKMFDLWASASFQYNGSDVKVAQNDGSWKQYFFGATLKLDPVSMGAIRYPNIEGYKYAEVYSRLKVDTVLGIKWFGVSIGQSIVEVEIGSTVAGNVYKGGKVV